MELFENIEEIKASFPHACVTVGNFDGVHLGHQLLFAEIASLAYRHGGTSVAVTFNPHPLKVLREGGIKLISTFEQKAELIGMAGVDVLVAVPFTREFAATTASTFVDDYLLKKIGMKELVVGYDYCFGKGRQGNTTYLREQGSKKGFPVTVLEAHHEDGMLVSSSKIRELVAEGRMRDVHKLLGRNYQIRGTVEIGKKRGASLGFPTANLRISSEDLCPKRGVYVTQVICEGKCYGSVSNIGVNPTFGDGRLTAETHIFNFNRDIYNKPIKINFLRYLRAEKKFPGPGELVVQIGRDVAMAREVLDKCSKEITLACEERYNR